MPRRAKGDHGRWLLGLALLQAAVAALYTAVVLSPLQWPPSLDAEGAWDFVPTWAALAFYTAMLAAAVLIRRARGSQR